MRQRCVFYFVGWDDQGSDAIEARSSAWKDAAIEAGLVFEFVGTPYEWMRENCYKKSIIRLIISLLNAFFMAFRCLFKRTELDDIVILSSPPFFSMISVALALKIIMTAKQLAHPVHAFTWLPSFDLLTGSSFTRHAIDSGDSVMSILKRYEAELFASGFLTVRDRYLLYPR